jgi:hypothetical protein
VTSVANGIGGAISRLAAGFRGPQKPEGGGAPGPAGTTPPLAGAEAVSAPAAHISSEEIADLRRRLTRSLDEINLVAQRLIDVVEGQSLPPEEKRKRIESIQERAEATADEYARSHEQVGRPAPVQAEGITEEQLADLRAGYERKLTENEETYHERLAELERRLSRRERELVALYNPVFSAQQAREALSRAQAVSGPVRHADYRPILAQENIIDRAAYERLVRQARDLEILTDQLAKIPYKNSVPQAIQRVRQAGRELASGYDRMWTGLADSLQQSKAEADHLAIALDQSKADAERYHQALNEQQQIVQRFLAAMDRLTFDTRETGYVLDSADPESILLYVGKVYGAKVGDLAYIFRNEDELIATVRIVAVDDSVQARLVQLSTSDRPIRPFDKVLIEVTPEVGG